MKAQELRIGNLLYNDNVVVTIDARTIFDIWDDAGLKKYNPIPLTEKWFIKFGFKKDANGNYWRGLITHYLKIIQSGEYFYPYYIQIPEFSSENENRVSLNRIQHIHQLQNLFYSLCGEELL
jgi:hypothetical protein